MFYAFVSAINTLEQARDFNVKLYSVKHGRREATKGIGRGADPLPWPPKSRPLLAVRF